MRLDPTSQFLVSYRRAAVMLLAGLIMPLQAHAEKIENGTAVFAALDKVTARISKLEVRINETKRFGTLNITPRSCSTRPPEESPKTTSFVEIDDAQQDGSNTRLFSGWMFAESPGLNGVEHPVFDVWLTECMAPIKAAAIAPAAKSPAGGQAAAKGGAVITAPLPDIAPANADDQVPQKRRPRR